MPHASVLATLCTPCDASKHESHTDQLHVPRAGCLGLALCPYAIFSFLAQAVFGTCVYARVLRLVS